MLLCVRGWVKGSHVLYKHSMTQLYHQPSNNQISPLPLNKDLMTCCDSEATEPTTASPTLKFTANHKYPTAEADTSLYPSINPDSGCVLPSDHLIDASVRLKYF